MTLCLSVLSVQSVLVALQTVRLEDLTAGRSGTKGTMSSMLLEFSLAYVPQWL